MHKSIIPIAVLSFVLSGCASFATQNWVHSVEDRMAKMRDAPITLHIDLINKNGLSEVEIQDAERIAAEKVTKTCSVEYDNRLPEIKKLSGDPFAPRNKILSLFKEAEKSFAHCASQFDVVAWIGMSQPDGSLLSLHDHAILAYEVGAEYATARGQAERESAENGFIWATAGSAFGSALANTSAPSIPYTNPSQTYVGPYLRNDGTFVSSHRRTNPNSSCLDNIRGCR